MVGDIDIAKVTLSNILRDAVLLCEKFGEPLEIESSNSKTVSTLLNVPAFKSEEEFKGGLDSIMQHLFEEGGPDKVVRTILKYFQSKCNKELLEELSRIQIGPPKVMDQYDVAALMIHSNIELSHWRKVVQCLKMFMGVKQVCTNETRW